MIRHLDLFAGIGGFSRAVEWLGGETVAFVEWDAWNRRVIAKHWPEAHVHGDIKTLTAATLRGWGIRTQSGQLVESEGEGPCRRGITGWPETGIAAELHANSGGDRAIDLITGGYPCQPFSLAGQRLGAADDRHLWPEMRRVIDLVRPRFILAENVSGHVTMGLDTVLAELEADGYACGAVVVPACAVNALHRRDRVWIIATLPDAERGGWGEQLRVDAAQGPLPASEWAQGALGTRSSGEDATVAHTEGGTRIPAAHGGASGERGAARMEVAGSGGRFPEHGTDAIMGDANGAGLEGWGVGGERAGERPAGSTGGEPLGDDRQTPRTLDARIDGIPAGLVRRPAAGPADPDLIRAAWADGSWEDGLPRVVTTEPERRQKLQAAGNAIVPVVAYEILWVMLGHEEAMT